VTCAIEGCDRPAYARGWCERHYSRFKNHGDPLGGGPDRQPLSPEELRQRLRDHLGLIRDPIALAHKYLAHRRLLGHRDEDELVDAAIGAIVNAALAWDPNGGRSILSWAYLYMDRDVYRAIGKRWRERDELGIEGCITERHDDAWMTYRSGTDWYDRIELRVDLQRWADLAELNAYQRFVVDYGAHHAGVYVRDTPLAGSANPFRTGHASYRAALGHMRKAAITGERRDDKWTRRTKTLRERRQEA
jgi:hypothetical protein